MRLSGAHIQASIARLVRGLLQMDEQARATERGKLARAGTLLSPPRGKPSALDPMAEGHQIRNFGEGTTHTTIYFPEIRALHICLAPKAEQIEIVRRVRQALAKIEQTVHDAPRASSLLDRLDQSILAKAFRGELVPQDPADEPASVLLDRIRAEREAGGAPKRRGRGVRPGS
jgi:hypothetical protein